MFRELSGMRLLSAIVLLPFVAACAGDANGAPSESAPDAQPPAVDAGELPAVDAGSSERAQQFLLPSELPAARGNKYADQEEAALFGFHLFFDKALGNAGGCPKCHLPELAFTDRVAVSIGMAAGIRNAPTTFNASRLSVLFWDGKADSLWSQALFAIESPVEMASSRLELAHHIASDEQLRSEYEVVFGSMPDLSSWPRAGKPGDAAFDGLSEQVKEQVNRIAANVGKALEAYQRKNSTGRAALDRFLLGEPDQLSEVAREGLDIFLATGCDSCHGGPMLTDEAFHDVGFPSLAGAAVDPGRAGGLPVLLANPFNLQGSYADPGGAPAVLPAAADAQHGAFRTPSLRNVARTAPYGHDGALATLREVLTVHAPQLGDEDKGALIAFLGSLNGDYPPLPWSKWPSAQ